MAETKTRVRKEPDRVAQFRASLAAMDALPNAKKNNKSIKWFKETVEGIPKSKIAPKLQAGKMYTYVYDAKYKKTLPYWDRFPLIIMLDVTPTHQLGLNLHYLPPKARQVFMEKILKMLSQKNLGPKAYFKINWDAVKRYPGAEKMIKCYIRSRIKGHMVEINPMYWANAIYLPTQQFLDKDGKRFSARKVWADGKTH